MSSCMANPDGRASAGSTRRRFGNSALPEWENLKFQIVKCRRQKMSSVPTLTFENKLYSHVTVIATLQTGVKVNLCDLHTEREGYRSWINTVCIDVLSVQC